MKWTFDKAFPETVGRIVRVLQREVSVVSTSIQEELEPFCCLPTLLTISQDGKTNAYRGVITGPKFLAGSLSFGLRSDDESGDAEKLFVDSITEAKVTVWRVNEALDAIQLNMIFSRGRLCFQTGGAELLDLILLNPAALGDGPLSSARELFLQNANWLDHSNAQIK